MPIVLQLPRDITRAPAIAVPDTDPVACRKIAKKGTPVGDLSAVWMSPRQKYKAIIIPNPMEPLINTVNIKDKGTAVVALVISSTIYDWNVSLSLIHI